MSISVAAIAAFVLFSPFINAAVQNVNWSPKTKALVAWGVSIVLAVGYLITTGGIADPSQLLIAAPTIYGYQQAIYTFLVKNIATKFEALTTGGSVIVAPSTETGKVDITTDETIKSTGDHVTMEAPVQVSRRGRHVA